MKSRNLHQTLSSWLVCILLFISPNFKTQNWQIFGTGADDHIYDIVEFDSSLFVAGRYYHFNGIIADGMAIWHKVFSPNYIWQGVDIGWVYDIEIFDSTLYVAGDFGFVNQSTPAGCIAKYNGSNVFSAVGNGGIGGYNFNADIQSLEEYNGALYAGGTFTSLGGTTARNIAKWNGSNWSAVGGGLISATLGGASRLFSYNGELYASGTFTMAGTTPVPGIAKWNGSAWSSVANFGMNGSNNARIYEFEEYNGLLYAAGNFSVVDGIPAHGIAIYDGLNWFDGSSGLSPTTNNFQTFGKFNGELYASGTMNGSNRIMKWDINSASWTNFATLSGGFAGAICEYKGSLIAGGSFTMVNGAPFNRFAKYTPPNPVALNEIEMDQSSVYPNPFSSKAVFQSAQDLEGYNFALYNSNGVLVKKYSRLQGRELTIYSEGLYPGIYLLTITDPNGRVSTKKIILDKQ